jgi:ribosomal protein S18 acetylase RimI-like enzyme
MAKCHAQAFEKGDVLSLLGPALIRGFYRYYLKKGVCLVAVDVTSGRLAGVVIGGAPALRRKFVLSRSLWIGPLVVSKLFTNRYIRQRFWANLKDLFRRKPSPILKNEGGVQALPVTENPCEPMEDSAQLRSICTQPEFARRGVGKALLKAFGRKCNQMGYKSLRLRVALDNQPALDLYKKNGWKEISTDDTFVYLRLTFSDEGDLALM